MNIKSIVILHGWGLSGDRYIVLHKILEDHGFKVYSPDLPGFGENTHNDKSFSLLDLATFLDEYIRRYNIASFVVIAHSNGGRVLIKFLQEFNKTVIRNKLKGIVLTGTPLIKSKMNIRKRIGVASGMLFKSVLSIFPKTIIKTHDRKLRWLLYKIIGEWDYYNSGNKKKTFLNMIKEDFEESLSKVSIPTLILWGENDTITPINIGLQIHSKIKASIFISSNAGHKFPYEKPTEFADNVLSFINSI